MAKKKNEIETKVVVDASQVDKSLDKASKSAKTAAGSLDKLDDATGGLITSFKALIANPIGITIAALAGLFKLLQGSVKRSSKASDTFAKIGAKLNGILNGIMAVMEPLVELLGEKLLNALNDPKQAVEDLGNAIKESLINRVKSFMVIGEALAELMKGNFKKALKLGTDGAIQFATGITNATDKAMQFGEEATKAYKNAAKATYDLAGAEKALARNRIALEKQQLKSLKLAEDERQIRDDISKTIEERIAANNRLGKILDEQLQRELALAQQNLNFARLQQAANGYTVESIEAVGDAEIKLLEIQERINGQRSEMLTNEQALLKEKREAEQKIADEAAERLKKQEEEEIARRQREFETEVSFAELEIERKREAGERTLELELELLEKKRLQDISNKELTEEQIRLINERAAFEKEKLNNAVKKAEEAKEKEILKNTIDSAAEAFGVTQEVALARMLIAAPEAIGNSFKEAAKAYAPPLSIAMGALGAAGVIAPILQGIRTIKSTRFSKKSSSPTASANASGAASLGGAGASGAGVTPELVTDLAANNAARLGTDTSLGDNASATAANNVAGGASGKVVFQEGEYNSFQKQVQFKEDKTTI